MRKWKELSLDEIGAVWSAYIRTEHISFLGQDYRKEDVPMHLTYPDLQRLIDELITRLKEKNERRNDS